MDGMRENAIRKRERKTGYYRKPVLYSSSREGESQLKAAARSPENKQRPAIETNNTEDTLGAEREYTNNTLEWLLDGSLYQFLV